MVNPWRFSNTPHSLEFCITWNDRPKISETNSFVQIHRSVKSKSITNGIAKKLCKIFKEHNWQQSFQDPHNTSSGLSSHLHQWNTLQTQQCLYGCMPRIHAFLSNLFRAEQPTNFAQNSWLLLGGSSESSFAKVSDLYCGHTSPGQGRPLTHMQKSFHIKL